MDSTLQSIVDFVDRTAREPVPAAAAELTKRHLIDAVACGAGAFSCATAGTIRRSVQGGGVQIDDAHGARSVPGWGASAYGIGGRVAPEFAGFANASTNRCLDFNDFGPAGHPSDMMPSQLAAAEGIGARGAAVIRGIFVAYEVATALADAVPFTEIPFDVGLYYSAGAAAGMAAVMGLEPDAVANAVSLAVVPGLPLRVTRRTPISQWRSSATAMACTSAAFVTRLAAAGLSGPPEPFEGPGGLFEILGHGGPVAVRADPGAPSAVERGSLKRYQACFLAQSAIDAARRVHQRMPGDDPVGTIRRIAVHTTRDTWSYVGGGAGDREEKWNPTSRETADHSIPYIVANVLLTGDVGFDSYSSAALAGRAWEPLIGRTEVDEDVALTDGAQAASNPVRLTVELGDGTVLTESSTFPYDASGRPVVSGTDVEEKFFELTARVLPERDVGELHELLAHLEEVDDLDRLGSLLRAFRDLVG
jgi:2-methylcitrate dehydratase